jgi:hypothetical protein
MWGRKFVRSYDGAAANAPKLVITYLTGGGPTATPTPTATAASSFPTTEMLDTFDRANGVLGSNWSGGTSGYSIAANQLDVGTAGNPIFWDTTSFGADQEIYVTFAAVDATGAEQDLLLKSQSNNTFTVGVIEVWERRAAGDTRRDGLAVLREWWVPRTVVH